MMNAESGFSTFGRYDSVNSTNKIWFSEERFEPNNVLVIQISQVLIYQMESLNPH